MKKIFFDTNFLVDYLLREQYFKICTEILEKLTEINALLYINSISVTNFAYIARKLPKPELNKLLSKILSIFELASNNKEDFLSVITMNVPDFEDGLQYQTALANDCDFIITRNQKDFEFSKIPVLSASEFLEKHLS